MTIQEAISCLKADKEYLVDNKVCDGEEIDVAININAITMIQNISPLIVFFIFFFLLS